MAKYEMGYMDGGSWRWLEQTYKLQLVNFEPGSDRWKFFQYFQRFHSLFTVKLHTILFSSHLDLLS